MSKNKTILVTGAAGFIGSHLCRRLIKSGYQVVALDNLNLYYSPKLKLSNIADLLSHKNFNFTLGDIANKSFLDELFKKYKIDIIVHLAARAGVRHSIEKPLWFKESNISGTVNLLELAKQYNIENFIFASSSSVYGERDEVPFRENQNTDYPISPYSASKKSCELFCYTYSYLVKVPVTILRFFNVYGPGMRPELAMPLFLNGIEKGTPIIQYGDGSMLRNYTYIDDIIEGVIKAIHKPTSYIILNLGGEQTVSLNDLIKTLESIIGKQAIRNILPKPAGDVSVTYADTTKAKEYLGWQPQTSFVDGCRNFIDWYHKTQQKKRIDIFLSGITKRVIIFSLNYALYTPYISGSETFIKEISNRVDHNYYDLICARFDKALPRQELIGNIQIYRVGLGNKLDKFLYPLLALLKGLQLRIKNKYDIVWGIMASYAGLTAMLFNLLNPRTKYFLSLYKGENKKYFIKRTWFWYPIYRMIYSRADRIQIISDWLAQRARRYGYRGEISLVPSGVISNSSFQYSEAVLANLRDSLDFKNDDIVLAIKTSPSATDSISNIVQILKYLPVNYKFILMVPESAELDFINLVKKLKLVDKIKFVFFSKNFDLIKYLKISNIFLKIAHAKTLGNFILEAMLYKIPVVASNTEGINDLIIDGQNGLLYQAGDFEDMAKKIKQIITDKKLKDKLIEHGFSTVSRKYDWETIAEKIKEIFENI